MERLVQKRPTEAAKKPLILGIDEMWTYAHKRSNEVWIWTVRFSDGRIAIAVGDRSEQTFEPLYESLPRAQQYIADDYSVYKAILPTKRHLCMHSNPNEGLHSFLRDALLRLKRKTKAYSKSTQMLRDSLYLAIWHRFFNPKSVFQH